MAQPHIHDWTDDAFEGVCWIQQSDPARKPAHDEKSPVVEKTQGKS